VDKKDTVSMELVEPDSASICAVIITWFPDRAVLDSIVQVLQQVDTLVIVDNNSSEATRAGLRSVASSESVYLIENAQNEGMARALNQAAETAIQLGARWMLTLDQDTSIRKDLVASLISVFKASGGTAAIIGSNYWSAANKRIFLKCSSTQSRAYAERKTVITSGSLVWLGLMKRIGRFREDYFIDSVDHEYCLRARARGYKVIISCAVLMTHSIGRSSMSMRRLLAPNHSGIRKYYMTRNALITIREYYSTDPVWAICQVVRLATELVSIVLLESNKREKLRYYFRGVGDALVGKMGPLSRKKQ
jgi:rhamnosyltransferase